MQIPAGDGALALHVMPRYMLHNNLQAGVQYKQQACPLIGHLLVCQILHPTSHPLLYFCLHTDTHTVCIQLTEHQMLCSPYAHCPVL